MPLTVHLGAGSDKFLGNDEPDTCYSQGPNATAASASAATTSASPGSRTATASAARATTTAGTGGQRRLLRRPGNDVCNMGGGRDGCHGGPGNDRLSAAATPTSSTATAATTTATAGRGSAAPTIARAAPAADGFSGWASSLCALALGAVAWLQAAESDAASRRCAPVVTAAGPGFTQASVLIVSGRVDCEKSRKAIFRALSTTPYESRPIEGWDCRSYRQGRLRRVRRQVHEGGRKRRRGDQVDPAPALPRLPQDPRLSLTSAVAAIVVTGMASPWTAYESPLGPADRRSLARVGRCAAIRFPGRPGDARGRMPARCRR